MIREMKARIAQILRRGEHRIGSRLRARWDYEMARATRHTDLEPIGCSSSAQAIVKEQSRHRGDDPGERQRDDNNH